MSARPLAAVGLLAATLVAACTTVVPITTETTPPTLSLNVADVGNPAENVTDAPMAVIPKNPKKMPVDNGINLDPSFNENYTISMAMIANDPGGIKSFGYSSQFLSFGGCNPNSEYGLGSSSNFPNTAVPLISGLAPTEQIGLVVGTAANERMLECGGTPGSDLAGVYVLTATATNYSNLTATATWYVNIGLQKTIPTEPNDGK